MISHDTISGRHRDDVVAEAHRLDASSVLLSVDQIHWLLARIDRGAESPPTRSDLGSQ